MYAYPLELYAGTQTFVVLGIYTALNVEGLEKQQESYLEDIKKKKKDAKEKIILSISPYKSPRGVYGQNAYYDRFHDSRFEVCVIHHGEYKPRVCCSGLYVDEAQGCDDEKRDNRH